MGGLSESWPSSTSKLKCFIAVAGLLSFPNITRILTIFLVYHYSSSGVLQLNLGLCQGQAE